MKIMQVEKTLVSTNRVREAAGSKDFPSDLTIVGIIDHWQER